VADDRSAAARLPAAGQRRRVPDPVKLGTVEDPLPAPMCLSVDRDLTRAVADAYLAGRNGERRTLADQSPGRRL